MNKSTTHPLGNAIRLALLAMFAIMLTLSAGQTTTVRAATSPAPVNLGTAAHFAILTKSGITNVPTSAITGDLGVSPIASTAITGFSLIADSTNTFSRSSQVTGKVYAANYANPTPANLTTAVSNMQTAYTDAAGRSLPDYTELYAGNLSGQTLAPGLYKWSSGVLVTSAVTLSGPADAVWIFQIAGNLTMGSGAKVLLSGGAQAKNVFWQVGGGTGVEIGTTAHVEGTILAAKAIHMRTGASLNGRALAQTAVTLAQNTIVIPPFTVVKVFTSTPTLDGWVLESGETTNMGGTMNATATTIRIGDNAARKQYRGILSFNTGAGLPDTAVITRVMLKVRKQGIAGAGNPITTFQGFMTDIRKGAFGGSALELTDFQSSANQIYGPFSPALAGNWYTINLTSGNSAINKLATGNGLTQIRLRFKLDDNNDGTANYLNLYSGNAAAGYRPLLVVSYYMP